jgi:hypothetical protein
MRADLVLLIAAGYAHANGSPESSRVGEVTAESVPAQAGMFGAECGQAGTGKATPLVVRFGVRLFDPAKSATAADLVVDGKHGLAIKVRGPLAPTDPLT